jgi:hypothetical protein
MEKRSTLEKRVEQQAQVVCAISGSLFMTEVQQCGVEFSST